MGHIQGYGDLTDSSSPWAHSEGFGRPGTNHKSSLLPCYLGLCHSSCWIREVPDTVVVQVLPRCSFWQQHSEESCFLGTKKQRPKSNYSQQLKPTKQTWRKWIIHWVEHGLCYVIPAHRKISWKANDPLSGEPHWAGPMGDTWEVLKETHHHQELGTLGLWTQSDPNSNPSSSTSKLCGPGQAH